MKLLQSCVTLLIIITNGYCARILGIFNIPSQSHHILGEILLKALAAKGHQVTMLSPFPSKITPPNYEQILTPDLVKIKDEFMKDFVMSQQHDSILQKTLNGLRFLKMLDDTFFNFPAVQTLIKSKVQYDLAIVVWFGNDASLALAHRLAKHSIVFSTLGSHYQISKLTKLPSPSSYVPNLHPPLPDQMNFIERLQNFLSSAFFSVYDYASVYQQRWVIDKYLPNSPSTEEIYEHVSLVLINTHYSLESPRPTVPQIIQVGGIQLQESTQLTGKFKTIMDKATNGAILFSLGSNVKLSSIDENMIQEITKCFAQLPYTVVWKFEKTDVPNLPKNVIISNWLPQRDLLAHANMKLFITHGGLLSTTEAIYNGVPMIGIPFFGDQAANVAESVLKGYAVGIPYLELSEETLSKAISEVMDNPKYRNNIQKRSRVFRDQPIKPIDTAVFWVEYVLRHDGAHHLKTSAFKLHWLQQYSVDVISTIVIILFGFMYVVRKICQNICKCLCKKSVRTVEKNKLD
ncbi:hypothetical protein FQR65_LT00801 [Abscondita terminalis]|nr:hypothetical protein FQR65_LT00801 [Abscondita terminalis]